MERNDIINSFEYKVSKEAVKRYMEKGIDVSSFEDGAEFAQKLIYNKVIAWLETEWEDLGIKWQRGVQSAEIIEQFKKDFGL